MLSSASTWTGREAGRSFKSGGPPQADLPGPRMLGPMRPSAPTQLTVTTSARRGNFTQ